MMSDTNLQQTDLGDLRQSYTKGSLRRTDLPDEPLALFDRWLTEAFQADLPEPYAMQLATALEHRPSVRTVLLRGYSSKGLQFYTHSQSHKGQDLAGNPQAEVLFFWPLLERQVRAYGLVTRLSETEVDQYFARRPRDSQVAAHVSQPQSGVIENRRVLEERFETLVQHWNNRDVPRPEPWMGYRLEVKEWEFWQGRAGRLHDRFRFQQEGEHKEKHGWQIDRLMP